MSDSEPEKENHMIRNTLMVAALGTLAAGIAAGAGVGAARSNTKPGASDAGWRAVRSDVRPAVCTDLSASREQRARAKQCFEDDAGVRWLVTCNAQFKHPECEKKKGGR